eukprot:1158261-Pelagomonas_calceolata.AAC.10
MVCYALLCVWVLACIPIVALCFALRPLGIVRSTVCRDMMACMEQAATTSGATGSISHLIPYYNVSAV